MRSSTSPSTNSLHIELMTRFLYNYVMGLAMSSAANNANNGSTPNPLTTAPSNASEVSQAQWLDVLKVLSESSVLNLQRAMRQFLEQKAEGNKKPTLPAASTLVGGRDEAPQNTYGTGRYVTFVQQSLEMDHKPSLILPSTTPTTSTSTNVAVAGANLDGPNGLDTLAAAALANSSAETSASTTSVVTVMQGKGVTGPPGGMIAIPLASQMPSALLDPFKIDGNQRQSPTIRETPKRLAATRAEAEQQQAAAATTPTTNFADAAKRVRLSMEGAPSDSVDASMANATANLLLSNGGLALKQEPDSNANSFFHQGGGSEMTVNWTMPSTSSTCLGAASVSSGETSRRRPRDEGITDDEAARREKRRERNRVAAAKCRQNRQNQIEDLKNKKRILEEEINQTKQRLDNARKEKAQLEELLKAHATAGCPTSMQYYHDGNIILRMKMSAAAAEAIVAAASAVTGSPSLATTNCSGPASGVLPALSSGVGGSNPGLRIIQPSSTQLLVPNPVTSIQGNSGSSGGSVSTTPTPTPIPLPTNTAPVIKPEAPSSGSSPPLTFVPAQRPNTLSLVTSTKLDTPTPTTASQLASLWTSSVAAKIKTPGGESWVNSQIGLPPTSSSVVRDKDTTGGILTTPNLLSTPDILSHLGFTVGSGSQVSFRTSDGGVVATSTAPQQQQQQPAPSAASTTTSTTNM